MVKKKIFCGDILNALCASPFEGGLVAPAVEVLLRQPFAVSLSEIALAAEGCIIHTYTLLGTAHVLEARV